MNIIIYNSVYYHYFRWYSAHNTESGYNPTEWYVKYNI